jgi:hypothetical protein
MIWYDIISKNKWYFQCLPLSDFFIPLSEFFIPLSDFFAPLSYFFIPLSDLLAPLSEFFIPLSDFLTPLSDFLTPLSDFFIPLSMKKSRHRKDICISKDIYILSYIQISPKRIFPILFWSRIFWGYNILFLGISKYHIHILSYILFSTFSDQD